MSLLCWSFRLHSCLWRPPKSHSCRSSSIPHFMAVTVRMTVFARFTGLFRTPSIWTSSAGWRGRRELAPRCSATQLAARRHAPGQTRRDLNDSYHTHHTHHHPTHTHHANPHIPAPRRKSEKRKARKEKEIKRDQEKKRTRKQKNKIKKEKQGKKKKKKTQNPKNPPDELPHHDSPKKKTPDRIIRHFFFESSESHPFFN